MDEACAEIRKESNGEYPWSGRWSTHGGRRRRVAWANFVQKGCSELTPCPKAREATFWTGQKGAFCQGTKSEGGGAGERLGCGVLGGTALGLGAAAAAPYYGYGDPCLRQQQVIDAWGKGNAQCTYARVC